jgi:putative ABC transport system substrate-binding protein
MNRRIFALTLSALLFALCLPVNAQQPGKIPRIGYVSGTGDLSNPGANAEAFQEGLRALGYSEGKTIQVEYRYIQGKRDQVPSVMAELVQLKVDVLVVTNPLSTRAAQQATKTIPIVMITTNDPVATGLVDSLARPGGNITGLTRLTRELSGKRLELLKEAAPGISRVGVLWFQGTSRTSFKDYEPVARALKIQLQSLELQGPNPNFEEAFRAAAKGRAHALITIVNTLLDPYTKRIADLTVKNRLPSMYERSDYVEAGGLMSYAANDDDLWRRAAIYVDKILKGAKPADLPVEQPTKFEFVVNLKTAKQIGLTIPPNVLARADKVIK